MNLIEILKKRNLLENYKEEKRTWLSGLLIKPRPLTDEQVRYVTLLLEAQFFLMRELIFLRLPHLRHLECSFTINSETYGDKFEKKVVELCNKVDSSKLRFEFRASGIVPEHEMTAMARVIFTRDLISIYGEDAIFSEILAELPKLLY